MRRTLLLGAIMGALVPASPAPAQEGGDEAAVLAAVVQLFDGMRAADSARVRAVFAPDARFAVLDASGGLARIAAQSVDGFVAAIAGSERRWNEQIYDVEVRVEDGMASVWAPYTFYLDGAVRHCGTNSIELLRDAEGWKITQVSDTRRTEGCPDPLGGSALDQSRPLRESRADSGPSEAPEGEAPTGSS